MKLQLNLKNECLLVLLIFLYYFNFHLNIRLILNYQYRYYYFIWLAKNLHFVILLILVEHAPNKISLYILNDLILE